MKHGMNRMACLGKAAKARGRFLLLLCFLAPLGARAEVTPQRMAEADARLREIFNDPTFPNTFAGNYEGYRKRLECVQNEFGIRVLEEAASTAARLRPLLGAADYSRVNSDILESVDSVLPTVRRQDQQEFYSELFQNYADETSDVSRFYLRPGLFRKLSESKFGLAPGTIAALRTYFFGADSDREPTVRTAAWFPEVAYRKISLLMELSSESQNKILGAWSKGGEFNASFRNNSSSGSSDRLLALLARHPDAGDEYAMMAIKMFVETRPPEHAVLAISAVDQLESDLSSIKALPEHPGLRERAFGLMVEALAEYKGLYRGSSGIPRRENLKAVLVGTANANGIFTALNRIKNPVDLEVLKQLVFPRSSSGEIEMDLRWLDKLGTFASTDAVQAAQKQYRPGVTRFEDHAERRNALVGGSAPIAKRSRENTLWAFARRCIGR